MLEHVKQIILNALIYNERDNDEGVYTFTNENIKDYLKDRSGAKALSIAGSGDQYFNLVLKGFMDIDLVDINPLVEYYIKGIKEVIIKRYTYEQFLDLMTKLLKKVSLEQERQIFYALLKDMPLKYRIFWQEIFSYYQTLQEKYQRKIGLFQILTQDYYFSLEEIRFFNTYLENKEQYEILRSKLDTIKSSFVHTNLFCYHPLCHYDLILCSNILEYTYHPNLNIQVLHTLFQPLIGLLNDNGMIYASYIYHFYMNQEVKNFPIGGSVITARELLREELLFVPSIHPREQDAVLVLRK